MKKKISTLFTLILLACLANAKTLTINKVTSAPIIDGTLEATWNNHSSNKADQFKGSNGDGFAAEFKMCYDNNNLYIAVSVTDPTPNIESYSAWQSDNVAIYIDMDTNASNSYRPGDWQIFKIACKTQADGGLISYPNTAEQLATFKVFQKDGNTYVQEWSIPWTTLSENVNFDGQHLRFDLEAGQANDASRGREFQAFWNSNADDQWTRILNQGTVVLKEKINVDGSVVKKPDLIINKVATAPTIDGILEPGVWGSHPAQACTQTKGTNGDGFATEFKMCYDDTNLYIAVYVTDPTPNIYNSASWQSDNVELYFAMDTSNSNTYRPGDWQFRKVSSKLQGEGGVEGYSRDFSSYYLEAESGIIVEQQDGATYIQEWSIAWTTLKQTANFDGEYFRFDLQGGQANDPETGREFQAFWHSNADDQYHIIKNQGTIKLSGKLPDVIQKQPDLIINKVTVEPTIDGILEPAVWDSQPSQACTQTKGTNGEGFATEFKMCYDNTNLYIAVSVTDPTPNIFGPSTWNSDCVDLYFAMDTNNSDFYRPGDWQIRKVASKTKDDGGLEGNPLTDNDKSNFKIEQVDGEVYVQEWAIPWSVLKQTSNFDGEYFRFDIQGGQANTSEIGREFQAFWHSNADDQYHIIKNQGTVKLSEKIYNVTEEQPALTINRVLVAPAIDGNLEPGIWDSQPSQACNKTKGTNGEGFATEFKMCYDDTNLYIAVYVTDPTPNIYNSASRQSDNVELYFAMDTSNSNTYRPGDWQFRKVSSKSQGEGGVEGYSRDFSSYYLEAESGIKVEQQDGATYIQEWSIAWTTLKQTANFDGEYFRFDLQGGQANDPETGREFQAFWHSNADDQYHIVKNQGTIRLKEKLSDNYVKDVDLAIKRVYIAPTIDGILEAAIWESHAAQACTKTIGSEGNEFSSEFKMCYDNENLYIAVSVTDPTPNIVGHTSWNSDCVNLYFAMDTNNSESYRPGDFQFRKVANKTQEEGGLEGYSNLGNLDADALSSIIIYQEDGPTYVQEWAIPWSLLNVDNSFDGKYFRFDLEASQANEPIFGRVFQAFWHSDANDQYIRILNHGKVGLGILTSINNYSKHEFEIKVYPNPSDKFVVVKSSAKINRYEVYNLNGSLIDSNNANSNSIQINTEKYRKGLYFIKLSTTEGIINRKILVSR